MSSKIILDGKTLTNFDKWQNIIGFVPQKIFILEETLKENIAFGLEANKNQKIFKELIEKANLTNLVEKLPSKESTIIEEDGKNLSGGEIQRIGIARALMRQPQILIMDEATSALDLKNEREIIEDLIKIHNLTIIFVTHRINSLEKFDKIYSLESGIIQEKNFLNSYLKLNEKIFVDHNQVYGNNYSVIIDDFIFLRQKKYIINPRWDNFSNLTKDYKSVCKLKREIFIFTYKNLQKYHKTNMGEIYWSIILTPWIDHLIPILFQIWKMISSINKDSSAEIYEFEDKNFIYNSFDDAQYLDNLNFNRWLVSKIITYQNKFKIKKKKIYVEKNNDQPLKFETIKYYLVNLLSKIFPSNKIMIKNIQIGFFKYILLSLKLRQFPFIWVENNNYKLSPININLRERIFKTEDEKKNLKNFIKKNMIYLIPKNYLENFNSINNAILKSYWPKKSNLIITSSSYWFNDFFKICKIKRLKINQNI